MKKLFVPAGFIIFILLFYFVGTLSVMFSPSVMTMLNLTLGIAFVISLVYMLF
jgi:hypothetical protein